MASGSQRFEHFDSYEDGLRALKTRMEEQRAAGYTVTAIGDVYTVTDSDGAIIQRSVLHRSRP
jgi:hypothetical protein